MGQNRYDFYCGIDVAKKHLDVALSSSKSMGAVLNNEAGFTKLTKKLPPADRTLIIMEASGGYEKAVSKWLKQQGFSVAVVNAKRVRDYARAAGKLAKTDRLDAEMIMAYGKTFEPTPQPLESALQEELEGYGKRREQLVKLIVMEKQHLESSNPKIQACILKHLEVLQEELKEIEDAQEALVKKDPALFARVKQLDGIKGVGKITALTMVTYLPELGKVTHKEVAALVGVAPYNRDSGQMWGKRTVWGGRSALRKALYMPVLSAIKRNPALRQFYTRLITQGKRKKVAIVACMRKLIIIMNAMVRDNKPWKAELNTM